MRPKLLLFILFFASLSSFAAVHLNFENKEQFKQSSILQLTITDAEYLALEVDIFKQKNLNIHLQLDPTLSAESGYHWTQENEHWSLIAASEKLLSDGIYGFLETVLGFRFYHPREYSIQENLIENIQEFSSKPVFKYRGFHLHTMHPLELTEDFMNDARPNALRNIFQYIDWLARNGQNYFEFNVLESINTDSWIAHAQQISSYAHQRGIECGLDLSLSMLQQKAYQLYESAPFKFESAKAQLIRNTEYMAQAGFDVWNVELSATEFTSGNQKKKTELLNILIQLLKKHNIKLMSRNHVVKPEKMLSSGDGKEAGEILAKEQGLMVHTVMFYSMLDQKAPVYRNENLTHMRSILEKEKDRRETWYFPESAYWVTFDNSVPMFLLPYFKARLDDIQLCDSLEIPGHITFSSGWEWGYGIIDYSIAQWSWTKTINRKKEEKYPMQYIHSLIESAELKTYLDKAEALQEEWIKEKELIRVMVAQTVTDELPANLSIEFHPRPEYSYPYIRNKASENELKFIEEKYLNALQFLGKQERPKMGNLSRVEQEIKDGIDITYLRAMHKFHTLSYLINHRRKNKENLHLQEAEKVRKEALEIVKNREYNYRYPLQDIAYKNKNSTCYSFGYLYPVHQLHFWEREEKQALNNRYTFVYRNIWNIGKTVGLMD